MRKGQTLIYSGKRSDEHIQMRMRQFEELRSKSLEERKAKLRRKLKAKR